MTKQNTRDADRNTFRRTTCAMTRIGAAATVAGSMVLAGTATAAAQPYFDTDNIFAQANGSMVTGTVSWASETNGMFDVVLTDLQNGEPCANFSWRVRYTNGADGSWQHVGRRCISDPVRYPLVFQVRTPISQLQILTYQDGEEKNGAVYSASPGRN
jgi:hypothetical protein